MTKSESQLKRIEAMKKGKDTSETASRKVKDAPKKADHFKERKRHSRSYIELDTLLLTIGDDAGTLSGVDPKIFSWLAMVGLNNWSRRYPEESIAKSLARIEPDNLPKMYTRANNLPKIVEAASQVLKISTGQQAQVWWNSLSILDKSNVRASPLIKAQLLIMESEAANKTYEDPLYSVVKPVEA